MIGTRTMIEYWGREDGRQREVEKGRGKKEERTIPRSHFGALLAGKKRILHLMWTE